jgi:NADPH-dependent curcumin reductase CurA
MIQNKTFVLKSSPLPGWPLRVDNFAVETRFFGLDTDPPEGGFTIANLFFSLDPGMRLRMVSPEERCYTTPLEEGQIIPETSIARVLKSDFPLFKSGDLVIGTTTMEGFSAVPAEATLDFKHIENPYFLPLTTFLGPLGIPGLTAYSSLFAIGKPKKGETIYVSAAAGGVGQVVGQLAKAEGLKVIGSVGSDEKLKLIKDTFNFDDGFNYKKEAALDALKRLAPEGIDIYYDNVGGEVMDAALLNMKHYGRIGECIDHSRDAAYTNTYVVSCGSVSQYSTDPTSRYRVANLFEVPARRLTMQGFIVFDSDMMKWSEEHREKVGKLLASGKMVYRDDITVGMDNAVDAFLGVLSGRNVGKSILQTSKTAFP